MWPWSGTDPGPSKSSNKPQTSPSSASNLTRYIGLPIPRRPEVAGLQDQTAAVVSELNARAAALPPHVLALSAFTVGSVSAAASLYVYAKFFRRLPTAEWVTPNLVAKKRWVKGYVTSVGDADNFRIYHTPAFGWRWPIKFRRIPTASKDLKDKTIHIRMAGIDAPEAGHFGRPAQAFAEEALAWLKSQVEGKTVYCQLLRRDHYGRIVAIPHLRPRLLPGFLATGKCISMEMLRQGWVQTYEQAGAEYGPFKKEDFLRIQAEAQAAKRGIWKYGTDGESPAEYKRRWAAADAKAVPGAATGNGNTGTVSAKISQSAACGWIRRLFRASRR